MIEDALDGLDDEQLAVVNHRKGPAIVIAGPGSGKTRTLTSRAAVLLDEGVDPEAIMMITFTRTAAKEMVRRTSALDPRAAYMTAGTFHAVGSKIVQANHHILGMEKEFTILDSDDVEQIIKKNMEAIKGTAKNWPRASTVAKVISYATNTGKSISDSLKMRAPDYEHLSDEIEAVAEKHTEYKLERGLLSYDDILLMWAALLEDEEIGTQLRRRWEYIMLDEQQDANWLQQQVVQGLAGPGGNVMAVGDPSQAIYHFRGSSPGVLKEFKDLHPEARIYTINRNYRSTENIVTLAASVDRFVNTGFTRTLRSASGRSGEKPLVIDVHDAAEEARVIAEAILEDKSLGGELSDHAILVRSTATSRRIEAEFISRKIPFTVQGGTRIDEAAHIKDLLSIARLTQNYAYEPAWLRLLTRYPKIGDKASSEISAKLVEAMSSQDVQKILMKEAETRRTPLYTLGDAISAGSREGNPAEKLERIISAMADTWKDVWHEDWKSRNRDLEAVVMIAQEHADLSDFLTTITLDGSIDRENKFPTEKADEMPVTISTIHGAKGLEYKKVHIPSFVQGGMPSMFANSIEEREEEKRIAFVAITRAKDSLTFYRPRFNGQGNVTMPSDYEGYILPYTNSKQHVRTTLAGDVRVETTRKIDIRAKMMRKN